ncbi:hypothetical protein R1sor_004709 [Riccia sorocarpa]|uniref:EF-hand domain-containing protein n=1 Tax=Riccia sorocarpa TaxID=122646 RepID=A0ABD3HI14_9MARC
MFYRFCGMDASKYYSERDLYLYLKLLARGMSKPGLFYPSEQDDGISYVNCQLAETLAEDPMLQENFGSQAAAVEFINNFVAAHGVMDKVSLEVKKITKSQTVKRIDFDEFMEAVLEKTSTQSQEGRVPRAEKKPKEQPKPPLTAEKRQALENLFIAGDANQDGVLTFTEFQQILSSADESLTQQTALRIFRETLLLEPEGGDKISPLAFATVANEHNIAAPPSVIYKLLQKTWLQIQGDINDNKMKDEASKKESDELRMKLARYIDEAKESTVDQAVQTFREFVLRFCGAEGEEDPPEDFIDEDEEEEQEDKPAVGYEQNITGTEGISEDEAGPSES